MDTTAQNPQFTNRIRELRERADVSLNELAQLTGISKAMLSRLERGERVLTDTAMTAIATALGVSTGFLINKVNAAGGPPLRGDFVEDEYEATVLRFWRSLSMDARVQIFAKLDSLANITPHDDGARFPQAVAK